MSKHLVIFIVILSLLIESHCDNLNRSQSSSSSSSSPSSITSSSDSSDKWKCEELDFCDDRTGFDAIKWLHHQLDDDANGNVDITESDEFLRDELHYENANDRHRNFHGNDKHISVDELWRSWRVSEVHNWTVDETLDWLSTSLELPQYVEIFLNHKVDGTTLPRLANHQFISALGIKDPIHRQKISLKAMDVVLFGPPKMHNYVKDIILVISCIIAVGGLWHAVITSRYSRKHIQKMLKDMDSLQKAEEQLQELQKELDNAKEEQRIVTMEKDHLQEILDNGKDNRNLLSCEGSITNIDDRVQELGEELKITKEQLARAETALMNKSWAPPHKLQLWLQYTHELELRHYNSKRQAAESQLKSAREGCEKLKKKRSSFLGSFKVAHGSSIDDVDNRIHVAKAALSEVTRDLRERLFRWQQMEDLCGFQIVENRGLLHIQNELYSCYPSPSTAPVGSPSTTSEGPCLTRNNSDTTIQDLDSDTFDVTKNPQLSRSATLRSKSSVPSNVASLIDELVSLSSQAASTTQLVQRNQGVNGTVSLTNSPSDENHPSISRANGEDDDLKQSATIIRPTFTLGDFPTIPENCAVKESKESGSRIGSYGDRRRKESVPINSNYDANFLPSSTLLESSVKIVNSHPKHRTFTRIQSLDEFTSFGGDVDATLKQINISGSVGKQLCNLAEPGGSIHSTNSEDKGYFTGGSDATATAAAAAAAAAIKKKSPKSSKGIKLFSALRKRKSLPEKEFSALVQTNQHSN